MSSSVLQNIECSECKKEFDIQVWNSINVNLNPELRDKVLDGSLYTYVCPHCGKESIIIYPFLYHDMTNDFMIFQSRVEDLNATKKVIRDSSKAFTQSGFDQITDDIKKRIVTNYPDLLEKICIFENGYDDRLIELCKLHIINDYNLSHEEQISYGRFDIVSIEPFENKPCIIFYDGNGNTVMALDASKGIQMSEQLKPLLDEDAEQNYLIDSNWAFLFLKKREAEQQLKRKEKNAFIVRWNVKDSVYGISLDDLKLQKKQRLKIGVEVNGDSGIAAGDLALVCACYDNCFILTYLGRFISSPRVIGENEVGHKNYVAEILVDINFHIFKPHFEKHNLLRFFKNENLDKGSLSEILKKDEVEYFMSWIVCMLIGLKNPSDSISFCKNEDHRQILANYAADFCPELKTKIFTAHNVTDFDMSLTYDSEKVVDHPMYNIETERLETILIPSERIEFKLPEENDNLIINGHEIIISGEYEMLFRKAGDSPDMKRFLKSSEHSDNYLTFLPLKNTELMDTNDVKSVLQDLRKFLAKNKEYGLIEINNGETKSGTPYIYYILKEFSNTTKGMIYQLRLHLKYTKGSVCAEGLFIERGVTGNRESMVYSSLVQEGKVNVEENSIKGWSRDPYDKSIKKGNLMNLSEEKKMDYLFPLHPLTECRRAVEYIIENN